MSILTSSTPPHAARNPNEHSATRAMGASETPMRTTQHTTLKPPKTQAAQPKT
jgi:hypothetical protein